MMSRRTFCVAAAVLLIAATCWWFLRGETDYINLPPTATGPWVAFGDSLTEGFGATDGNNYPAVLGRKLGVTIRNLGKSGETTSDGLSRLEEVAALQPRVVLLCFGGNDSLNQHSRKQTFANLAQMIDRVHQAGSFVVLIGIRSASLRDFNEEHFAKLAHDKRVLYVPDMLRGLAFKPVYMSDTIHPNDAGYQKIADRLEKKLRPLLPKLNNKTAPVGPEQASHESRSPQWMFQPFDSDRAAPSEYATHSDSNPPQANASNSTGQVAPDEFVLSVGAHMKPHAYHRNNTVLPYCGYGVTLPGGRGHLTLSSGRTSYRELLRSPHFFPPQGEATAESPSQPGLG